MKYKKPSHKKRKNTHALEVSCGHCKTPVAIYQKAGNGNLIKMLFPRIIESEINIEENKGHFKCPNYGMELAKKGKHNETKAYWIIRGKVNTKKLDNYIL